jgi:hypothetical protein
MTTTVKEMIDAANAAVPRITPAQARDMIAQGNTLIVDVREALEVEKSGKIAGAVNVSRGLLTVDASQFALTIAAPGSGVGILIYPRRRPELLVWMAPGMSLFRDCEGHRTRFKQPYRHSPSQILRENPRSNFTEQFFRAA